MSTQTRRILIKVDTTGARDVQATAKQLGMLNNSVKSMSGNMGFLTNSFQGFLGFLGVRELVRMSDSMQNLSNRLKIVTGSTEGAAEALDAIQGIAQRTNQGIDATGQVFTRLANSLTRYKITTKEVTALTEGLVNTFRIAGATTTETTNTIVQLSQAFSSGELRGQELRSVMEQNATLARLLQKEFDGDVYKKAAEGQIKITDVLRVLKDNLIETNEAASKLAPTFEQTLVKAMDSITVKIGELNQKYELSAKFATLMKVAVDNLGSALVILGTVALAVAISKIPALIISLEALWAVLVKITISNPYTATFLALATLGTLIYVNWDRVKNLFKGIKATVFESLASINEMILETSRSIDKFFGKDNSKQDAAAINSILYARREAVKLRSEIAKDLIDKSAGGAKANPLADLESAIAKIQAGQKITPEKLKKTKEILAEINKAFLSGAISAQEYSRQLDKFELDKVVREFSEGKTDIYKFSEALRDLAIKDLNKQLAAGAISLGEFNSRVGESKFIVLNEQMKAGLITLQDYNNELLKIEGKVSAGSAFTTGIQNYITSIGTFAEGIAKVTEQAFGHLEDSFMSFIKTGRFNFAQFTQSILDDLLKIIIRAQIIGPLAQGLMGAFSGGAASGGLQAGGGSYGAYAAKGMAFNQGNVLPFAKGGIVDSPTGFTFGGGKRGLMGEAGPEAILPLTRGNNGDLGVQASVTPVTVNIINQSGAGVEQSESTGPNGEKMIEVLITNKVREGISTGKFDTAMRSSYGILRKGA